MPKNPEAQAKQIAEWAEGQGMSTERYVVSQFHDSPHCEVMLSVFPASDRVDINFKGWGSHMTLGEFIGGMARVTLKEVKDESQQ